jgi:hypothetical protein
VHPRIDVVLVLATDRKLQRVPGCCQVQRAADRHERLREPQRRAALDPLRLDLRLLAQAFGVEERREPECEQEDQEAAQRGCWAERPQKRT